MKYLYLTVVLFLVPPILSGRDVKPKTEVERKLLSFFVKWRSGNPPLPLPNLNVITIPALNGQYWGKGVSIKYSSSEMQLFGMNNFTVDELKVLLGYYGMYSMGVLWVPELFVTADCYKLRGHAFHVYNLNGSGKLCGTFKGVRLSFLMRIASNGTSSSVTTLKIDFNIDNIQVNLNNSSWPINNVLNNEGLKIVDSYREEILPAAEKSIVRHFNYYLENLTTLQLLDIISQ